MAGVLGAVGTMGCGRGRGGLLTPTGRHYETLCQLRLKFAVQRLQLVLRETAVTLEESGKRAGTILPAIGLAAVRGLVVSSSLVHSHCGPTC